MNILTASQLRRKRRDRAWQQWIERSERHKRRLEFALRKYFVVERARVLRILSRIGLQAAEAEPLPEVQLAELRRRLEQELEENNEDWEDSLLILLLIVAAQFTNITTFDLDFDLEDFEETTDRNSPTPIPVQTETWTRQFIEAALVLIAATTLKRIIGIIADAQQKKKSVPATITSINEAYERFIRNRTPGIASDLVGKVASMAQQIAILQLPVPIEDIRQTWVSMRDEKVRDSHQDLDGETRKVGEEFKTGLKFPRDPRAPIAESINCRCWLIIEQVKKRKAA